MTDAAQAAKAVTGRNARHTGHWRVQAVTIVVAFVAGLVILAAGNPALQMAAAGAGLLAGGIGGISAGKLANDGGIFETFLAGMWLAVGVLFVLAIDAA